MTTEIDTAEPFTAAGRGGTDPVQGPARPAFEDMLRATALTQEVMDDPGHTRIEGEQAAAEEQGIFAAARHLGIDGHEAGTEPELGA